MDTRFCMMYCRFHIEDKNKIFLGGFWKQRRRKDTEILVALDYTLLNVEMESGRMVKMPLPEVEMSAARERMFVWAYLPENYESYKRLRVFEREETTLHELFTISTSKLAKLRNHIPMHVDDVCRGGRGTIVRGWCIAKKHYEIQVRDKEGKEVTDVLSPQRRPDVEIAYPESEREWIHGYVMDIPKILEGKITITVICDNEKEVIERVAIEPAWSKAGEKITNTWRKIGIWQNKAVAYYQQFGFKKTLKRGIEKLSKKDRKDYETYRLATIPSKKTIEKQRKEKFAYMPLIDIVVPLYKTPLPYLQEMIKSVQEQTYSRWKLYLSDGSGNDSELSKILQEYASKDDRICVIQNEKELNIAENTNQALLYAQGDFVAFSDHDDILEPNALYECVKVLNDFPKTELIYTDEDKVSMDGKEFYQPHFKPDFNLDYLRSINYINHLCVVKKTLLDQVGLLNPEYNGAQDYDLVLRCIEKTKYIYHIPKVLYHWRIHPTSVNGEIDFKSSAYEAGRKAILAHYKRVGIDAEVKVVYPGIYRSIYRLTTEPLISIIIANKDQKDVLEKCIESLEKDSEYRNFEILIVENNSEKEKTFAYYEELQKAYDNIHILKYEKEFNYADIQNFAVSKANGEYLLLLNNDTWLDNPNSIREMLMYCMREDVGIVGSRLLYPDDTVQHAGVIIGLGGVAGHAFLGERRNAPGYFCRLLSVQDLSAVTAACLMVKKSVYQAVGGMDVALKVAFNDVDFCMRVGERGYRIVYQPFSVWYHDESRTRGPEDTDEKIERFSREIAYFQERWKGFLQKGDPAYNPNLALDRHDFALKK